MAIGGYECEFVDFVQEFECPLCLHVTREPHQTDCCGQHFCQSCINRVLTDNKPCPFCKTQPFTVFYDKKQRRKVLELKVYCTEKDRGCDWTGELGELDSHLDSMNGKCQYVDVPCTNNCEEIFQRQQLPHHLKEECPKRAFTCQYCGYTATYEDVHNKHMPVCTKYPLPCPNNCYICMVERGSLEKHLSECPLQLVQCEFSHLGCNEKMQRKDIRKHMEESTQKHLVLLSAFTSRQISEKEAQISEIQGELQETWKEVVEIKEELRKRESESKEMQGKLSEKDQHIEQLQKTIHTIGKGDGRLPPAEVRVYKEQCFLRMVWVQSLLLYTHLAGAKIKIDLDVAELNKEVHISLWQVPGEFDEAIDWPVRCTVTVQILNQTVDKNHLWFSTECELNRPVKQQPCGDIAHHIYYSILWHSQHDIQYIKDDSLHIRANVTLK